MTAEKSEKPSWIKIKPTELETTILELSKEEKSPAKIGLILRDKHGVPRAKLLNKKIATVLKENKKAHLTEKDALERKVENIKQHIEKHKKDHPAKRALTKKLWAIQKMNKLALSN
jgi:ribosomal protein S15P/S13E